MSSNTAIVPLVQETEGDLDALEAGAGAVAWGDLAAEAPGALSELSLRRLFQLAQLTCEYLLHVQDCLVWEAGLLRVGSLNRYEEPSCCECLLFQAGVTFRSTAQDLHAESTCMPLCLSYKAETA